MKIWQHNTKKSTCDHNLVKNEDLVLSLFNLVHFNCHQKATILIKSDTIYSINMITAIILYMMKIMLVYKIMSYPLENLRYRICSNFSFNESENNNNDNKVTLVNENIY